MKGISGQTPSESSQRYGQRSSFSKTFRGYSASEEDLAYAAGLIDGEGCLGIYRRRTDGQDFYYQRISMEMSYKAYRLLKKLKETFGGSIGKRNPRYPGSATHYCWRLGQEDAARFLLAILPYLRLKVAQAEIQIVFAKECRPPWTGEKRKRAEELKQSMHRLNRTGPPVFPRESFAMLVGEDWVGPQMTLEGTQEPFSGPYPNSGTMRNGVCYRRPMSALPTSGRDSGSWPTPRSYSFDKSHTPGLTTLDIRVRGLYRKEGRYWPTPRSEKTTSENEETWRKRQERGDVATPPLGLAVKMWPTPRANDRKADGPSNEGRGKLVHEVQKFPTPNSGDGARGSREPDGKRGRLLTDERVIGGQLSPEWVELLMGWPRNWTKLD